MPDLIRGLVIMFGGTVVGLGFAVLLERVHYYGRRDLEVARRAMIVLALMNALTLSYIAATLIGRWGDPLTWRAAAAAVIFAVKGYFFILLRRVGIEQERRLMFGGGGV